MKKMRFDTKQAKDLLHAISLDEEKNDLDKCFFHNDPDHFCESELCSRCAYDKYLKTVSEDQFNNWDFIEGWEWHDHWEEKIKNLTPLIGN
jgi:hypothetical protein